MNLLRFYVSRLHEMPFGGNLKLHDEYSKAVFLADLVNVDSIWGSSTEENAAFFSWASKDF